MHDNGKHCDYTWKESCQVPFSCKWQLINKQDSKGLNIGFNWQIFRWEILRIMPSFFYFHKILTITSSCLYKNGITLNGYQRGNALCNISAELRQNLEGFEIVRRSPTPSRRLFTKQPELCFLDSLRCNGQGLTCKVSMNCIVICTLKLVML